MNPSNALKRTAPFLAALAISACNSGSFANLPVMGAQPATQGRYIPQWKAQHLARRACPGLLRGHMQCEALIMNGKVEPGVVVGWGANDIETAYNLPSATKGTGQIVAIVDSYDNPNVASDLAEYRSNYGLPAANFHKYNENGKQGNYPPPNRGWAFEEDIDTQMVSAACPNCKIDLIEVNGTQNSDAVKGLREAVKLGAHIVSNSWTCYAKTCRWNHHHFEHSGVLYLFAAGDEGYGTHPPMHFPGVVSVGGTVLTETSSTYSEVAWSDTGGGCSDKIAPKPQWQHDPGCPNRTDNDVAAVAWRVAVYDSYQYPGWALAAGTSIATPIIAGVFALAGNASSQNGGEIFWTLPKAKLKKSLHVISSGNDGCPGSIAGSYLCTAGTGQFGTYSGPTGWGTPNGIGAF